MRTMIFKQLFLRNKQLTFIIYAQVPTGAAYYTSVRVWLQKLIGPKSFTFDYSYSPGAILFEIPLIAGLKTAVYESVNVASGYRTKRFT